MRNTNEDHLEMVAKAPRGNILNGPIAKCTYNIHMPNFVPLSQNAHLL